MKQGKSRQAANIAIMWLMLAIAGYLCILSIFKTAGFIKVETTVLINDFPLMQLSIIIVAPLFLMFVRKWLRRINGRIVCLLFSAAGFIGSIGLIAITQVQPFGDQLSMVEAARSLNAGDLGALALGGYLSNYPHQLGLALVLQACVSIAGEGFDLLLFQGLNAVSIAACQYSLHRIAWKCFENEEGVSITPFASVLIPQLMLYVTFVYGNMIGLALSLSALSFLIDYLCSKRICHFLLSTLFIALAVAVKQNSLIFLSAMVLFLLTDTSEASNCKKSRKQKALMRFAWPLLLSFSAIALTLALQAGIKAHYGNLAQRSLDGGIPSVMHVAMGLQAGDLAPGWWNGYLRDSFREHGYDPISASEDAWRSINESIGKFMGDPGCAISFFYHKTASMWVNPTFQAFWLSTARRESRIAESDFAQSLYHGSLNAMLTGFMNAMQTLVYFGSAAFCALSIFKPRLERKPCEFLPAAAFVGGFVFHLVWEAKCQFALPYYAILFPYAACGLARLSGALERMASR
jgi:hypothetical protein